MGCLICAVNPIVSEARMVADKKYWQINTDKLAKEIKEAARKATTEEDLKMSVEPLLQNVFTQMGWMSI